MLPARSLPGAAIVVLMAAGAVVWYACDDRPTHSPTGPLAVLPPDLHRVIAVQQLNTDALLAIPGVVGTAVTLLPDGRAGVQLLLELPDIAGLPQALDVIPVTSRVTGRLISFSDPTKRAPPAPPAFSAGPPSIN